MATELLSSSRFRAVIGLATAALLAAGLLSSRVMTHHELPSGTQMSTTNQQTSNFVASGGLVPDGNPSVPEAAEALGNSDETKPTDAQMPTF